MAKVTLSKLSVAALQKEIARREKKAAKLARRRAALVKELAALDAQLGTAPVSRKPGPKPGRKPGPKPGRKPGPKPGRKPGPKPGPKPGRKPGPKPGKKAKGSRRLAKNAAPLPPSMAAVMSKDTPMGVREIMAAVTASGYKSISPHFETIVYQALRDKRFKRASRGKYVLA